LRHPILYHIISSDIVDTVDVSDIDDRFDDIDTKNYWPIL